ncbi:branched-chain amino acid ABC transporter permease [Dactylosporangium sp. CA-233914]|uniref:branched-chain amino acid ABC transporter permease n=1 Tax=Dactylosporangium sp. CA-233914 TaxID=3239934 RepID=UPI003D8E12E5
MTDWYNAHIILVQGTFTSLLLALSIQIPLRMGVFSFAGIGFYGIGAYTAAIVTIRFHWPSYLAIGAGMLLAALVGYLLGLVVRRLDGLYLGMATIAFALILAVAVNNGGSLTGGASGLYGAIASIPMYAVVIVVVVLIALIAYTERGKLGRRIEVLREDPQLAMSVGINVKRLQLLSFIASGLLGALSGGIHVLHRTTVSPEDIGFPVVVTALTMIVVGGAQSWLGAAIGAVTFTWLPSVLTIVGQWQAVIYGSIVALAAVWVPGGLVGLTTDTFRSVQAKRRRGSLPAAASTTERDDQAGPTGLEELRFHTAGGNPS